MTVTSFQKRKSIPRKRNLLKNCKEFTFIFENSHSLLNGVLFLYRNKATENLKSSLYRLTQSYCLIIYSKSEKPYFLHLKEYCKPTFSSPFLVEYIKEYGKLLINENAVKKLGNAFFKKI